MRFVLYAALFIKARPIYFAKIDRQRGSHTKQSIALLMQVEVIKVSVQGIEQQLAGLQQSRVLVTADLNSLIEDRDKNAAAIED